MNLPLALSNKDGAVRWAARHDPWGNIEEEFNANPEHIEQTLRLPGQFHDRITGLYCNRHRFYDPAIGAYIRQDPIGLKGGINLSAYVKNPVQWMDPWELQDAYGWQSVPMFNGNLPGNQAALNEAIRQEEIRQTRLRTQTCLSRPPCNNPDWTPYYGDSTVFHCGFSGYLANVPPLPDTPKK